MYCVGHSADTGGGTGNGASAAALLKQASLLADGLHDQLPAGSKLHCQMLVNIAQVLVSTSACACASSGGGMGGAGDHSASSPAMTVCMQSTESVDTVQRQRPASSTVRKDRRRACL